MEVELPMKGRRHLETTRRDGAEGGLNVVGDPFDKVGRILVLNTSHLILDFLHGDFATTDPLASRITREVSTHKMAEQVR